VEELLRLSDRCPNCGARALLLDTTTGEVVCRRCGAVVRERLVDESGGEKSVGDLNERAGREHHGPPATPARHDMGVSSVIGHEDRDAGGSALGAEVRSMMRRLRLWDGRNKVHGGAERSLVHALDLLEPTCAKLSLPQAAAERAALVYRRARDGGLVRGRSVGAFAAASVLAAVRELGIPRRISDVAAAAGLGRREVYAAYRLLVDAGIAGTPRSPQVPEEFVPRAASAAGLPEAAARRALEIIREARDSRPDAITGRDPVGLAGAAVYVAAKLLGAGDGLTEYQLASALGVTDLTLRHGVHALGYRFDRDAREWVKAAGAAGGGRETFRY